MLIVPSGTTQFAARCLARDECNLRTKPAKHKDPKPSNLDKNFINPQVARNAGAAASTEASCRAEAAQLGGSDSSRKEKQRYYYSRR